jgi:Tfp pilus assembly protein PilF
VRRNLLIGLLLGLVTAAIYCPGLKNGFIHYDDPLYVTENPRVRQGLSWASVQWAFTTGHASNWHPLTWLSHMVDCQIYGLKPWGHHLTNLLFHLANTLLLFGVWNRMTGALWRSSFVAALFALHPLHVESIAWVAERKDVLSTFFFMLTIWAYALYAEKREDGGRREKAESRKPKAESRDEGSGLHKRASWITHRAPGFPAFGWYLLSLLFLALGLMSKPMLVTLPFVLLLLDYWPMGRLRNGRELGGLMGEKIPFFALAGASSLVTFLAQKHGGSVIPFEWFGMPERIANALVSYARYLQKTIWPTQLSVFYPHPGKWPAWEVAGAACALAGISALLLLARGGRRRPYLAVGWLWYLGTLAPVIGLVQVGTAALADRYTYIPLIGVFVIAAWGGGELLSHWPRWRAFAVSAGIIWIALLAAVTSVQGRYWKSNESLFAHAIEVTPNNCVAFLTLGTGLVDQRRLDEAVRVIMAALRINPDYPEAHLTLGNALAFQGKLDEAINQFMEAARLKPGYAQAQCNWGTALAQQGKPQEAAQHFLEAVRLDRELTEARMGLGNCSLAQGRMDEAMSQFISALKTDPGNAAAHHGLATVFAMQNRFVEARDQFRAALKIDPGNAAVLNDLAWLLAARADAGTRDVPEAIRLASRACERTTNREAMYLDTLAVAYSEAGRFADAIRAAKEGRTAALASGQPELAHRLEQRIARFEEGRAYTSQ